jgi:hypothetical protein
VGENCVKASGLTKENRPATKNRRVNIEQGISKDLKTFDPEDRLLDFTVRIFRHPKSFEKRELDFIFVLSYVASLKLTPWNEFTVYIPRGEVLLKP